MRPAKKLSDEVVAWLFVQCMVQMIKIWSSKYNCHPIMISVFINIQNDLIFLVPPYPGCPGKEATTQVSVFQAYAILQVGWLGSNTSKTQLMWQQYEYENLQGAQYQQKATTLEWCIV